MNVMAEHLQDLIQDISGQTDAEFEAYRQAWLDAHPVPAAPLPGLAVGRIVHVRYDPIGGYHQDYINRVREDRAAIINSVADAAGIVNLTVFLAPTDRLCMQDGHAVWQMDGVPYDADGRADAPTWHWPERT